MESSAISVCQPTWILTVHDTYNHDPVAQGLLQQLAVNGSSQEGYSLKNGIIRKHGKIWIHAIPSLQHAIITEFHASPMLETAVHLMWHGQVSSSLCSPVQCLTAS
jgi:hypothetical protein